MLRVLRACVALLLLAFIAAARPAAAGDAPKVAPFTAVRWKEEVPEVEIAGRWYVPLTLDGVSVADLVKHCRTAHGDRWQRRFEEDLPEMMAALGKKAGPTMAIRVRELATGAERVLGSVKMTAEHRAALRDARRAREPRAAAPDAKPAEATSGPMRVRREHAAQVPEALRPLLRRHESGRPVAAAAAAEDLDELEWILEFRFSYAKRLDVDVRPALDAVRAELGAGITDGALAIQLQKVIALFGDGHSGVADYERALPPGFAPFLVEDATGGAVAFRPHRTGLLDDARPFLRAIDGVPLGRWLDAASTVVARGAPHYARFRAIRTLRWIAFLRAELGLPASATMQVEVARQDGSEARTIELPLAVRRPIFGAWPRSETRVLDGNVGYLRLASMDDEPAFLEGLVAAMATLKGTKGLVIDVRGNGGGSRAPLRVLFPYFLRPDDPPRLANVAAYRLGPDEPADRPEGTLASRFLYPAAWSGWSVPARKAIDSLSQDWKPEWAPPAGDFSAWHYFVLERDAAKTAFSYAQPVVILADTSCFSATDVFLGAFQGHRNVTILGAPSGGGSGRKQTHRLANSGIEVELSTMASFRPDGRLYDGRGIEPDVPVAPDPNDFRGASDAVLKAALDHLK